MTSKIKINLDALKTKREWKRFKIKDGHNVFRILPPFGERSNGYPYRKWQIVWGLKDPDSQRVRPFASSLLTEKRCPIVEYVQELKKKAERIRVQMQTSGSPEEEIRNRLAPLNKLISDLSPKTIYIYNAVDKSGEVGLLELKSTAHKKMKQEMASYINDYNQDPTSLNSAPNDSGVWFDIIRTGMGRETEYDVKRVSIKTRDPVTGKISFEDDRSPLPDSVVENFESLAYDLSSIYQVRTYDELKQILEANMPYLVETYPDADLDGSYTSTSANTSSSSSSVAAQKTATTAAKPSKFKFTVQVDDEEEYEDEVEVIEEDEDTVSTFTADSARSKTSSSSSSSSSKKKATMSSNFTDDFLAEADALLNS